MIYKKYIDWQLMFDDLYNECQSFMKEYKHQNEHYEAIISFREKTGAYSDFEIEPEECEITENFLIFSFGFSFNNSNESNNQSETANYSIRYDLELECFEELYYEQG